jgi:mono/diheme cytochrome c family protein
VRIRTTEDGGGFLVLQEAGTLVKVGQCSAALFLALALASSLAMSGCDSNSYSAAIRYLVRTDPLVTTDKVGEERYTPDRPGQLPLFSAKDLLEFPNPEYFATDLFSSGKMIDPTKLSAEDRKTIQTTLDDFFGTPAEPKVGLIDNQTRAKLRLEPKELEKGSHYYRLHCLHCHGVTGNGRGPTAKWVNPHPRDYRQGLFKFQSTDQVDKAQQKPSRGDLYRTLHDGIEGTAMPAFNLLSENDLNYLVSYVMHLSIRGEVEFRTIQNNFTLKGDTLQLNSGADLVQYMKIQTNKISKKWLSSQTDPIPVAPYPNYSAKEMEDSVKRGQAMFEVNEAMLKNPKLFPKIDLEKLKAASCVSCHKDFGRQATFRFDDWGTLVRPADLTRGVYRGGRRPVDIYYRIHSGINGSEMVPFGGALTGDQIWDLVNFVRALPFKGMRDKYGLQIN